MMNELDLLLTDIFNTSRESRNDLASAMLHCNAENGELAEAVNYQLGNLPHKTMKEPLAGEVADVIICALDVLRKAYPESSNGILRAMLIQQLEQKYLKWLEIVVNENAAINAADS